MSERPPSPVDHLRAALVLGAGLAMFVLATPGLDQIDARSLIRPADRAKARWLTVALADLNRAVRVPVVALLEPIQRPLRIAQNWSLYGSGPSRARRFEVRVDGKLRYRSQDPEHAWLAPTFRYRRIMPIVVALCQDRSKSDEELVRFIVGRAREEFDARQVIVTCTAARWPGTDPEEVVRLFATAPDWVVTR